MFAGISTVPSDRTKGRGYAVLSPYDLTAMSGRTKDGKNVTVNVDQHYATVDPLTAIQIFQRCAPVFGIVTSRANKVSSVNFRILSKKDSKQLDKLVEDLKNSYSVMMEYKNLNTAYGLGIKIGHFQKIRKHLPDCLPDLSNFNQCLYRYSKRLKGQIFDKCQEIEDWFKKPSPGILWNDFCKQWALDLLVHGRASLYKRRDNLGKIADLYVMPGGTVLPIKGKFLGGALGYIQFMYGNLENPQLFYTDEVSFSQYMPSSALANGFTPLDCLINMVAEQLLFEQTAVTKADGSTPPQKLLVFGDTSPGFSPDQTGGWDTSSDPLDKDEQKRIEEKLNRQRRENAIAIISGTGQPFMVDLTGNDIFGNQISRLDQIKKYVAIAYNASNLEINETGGDGTSGRSTSETQERNDNSKGIRPILKIMGETCTHEIIPEKFGFGYDFEFMEDISESEQLEIVTKKVGTGLYSKNELRVKDLDEDPINDPAFDIPEGSNLQNQLQGIFGGGK
ncbi:portal protein [Leptospira phage LE4]|uniref:Portal protein n=1 Tax=Leptospira phage LE4 TaxID=2041383 RepID=A0A343LEC4_9CAUD|nr:portal protein [Leptospira phage LE4]ATN95034.1 portal protein [Leptospira phage LE4]